MEKFIRIRGAAAPLLIDNINTDQITPVQFMRSLEPDYQAGLFARWRTDPNNPFVLDQPRFQRAPILVTGRNFGCGSAREVAVWALAAHGVRCIVARSFSEVYRESLIKNGMLPVVLDAVLSPAFERCVTEVDGQASFEVDLARGKITSPDGMEFPFAIDAGERTTLLEGLDDVAVTLQHRALIEAWERNAGARRSWLQRIS
ncbi:MULTISPECIES: 3-isopropylmalate dehydratase small subunit [unclassified Beijerinckia]|uniref:3-isopropylmalate dehydratase small subunit n=1 Tax=unclassified Beijerinckia TaxID=2638183 RepID=UPI0008954C37|nr:MULTISPECIES: 3-isopropylmalate dehydratase small subunit [unclassified Beijerinckia]MDH7795816.1 3-isopropylmalate/(R)-2-methylmalate dehydratase small subunit [Beijerinckia sp. GAS462]SEC17603.1 3-isopropylmalate/(R)-2-methylmalate dehydratase small subunit [Beijerinckia sp. 28-YEA-48]